MDFIKWIPRVITGNGLVINFVIDGFFSLKLQQIGMFFFYKAQSATLNFKLIEFPKAAIKVKPTPVTPTWFSVFVKGPNAYSWGTKLNKPKTCIWVSRFNAVTN